MKEPIKNRVNIRAFSRNIYSCITKLPLVVFNKRTKKDMFVVISPEKGKELYELETDDAFQSEE